MCPLHFETKLWMVNEKGEAVFGNGLAELLEEIDNHHSILEAANHLEMSYRYALHRLTLAEERLGEPLVTRVRGGAKGGGSSQVTDFGRDLVKRYRTAQAELDCVLKKMPRVRCSSLIVGWSFFVFAFIWCFVWETFIQTRCY